MPAPKSWGWMPGSRLPHLCLSRWFLQHNKLLGGSGLHRPRGREKERDRVGMGEKRERERPSGRHIAFYGRVSEVTQHHFGLILLTSPPKFKGRGNEPHSKWGALRFWKRTQDWKYCCGHFWIKAHQAGHCRGLEGTSLLPRAEARPLWVTLILYTRSNS